MTEDRGSGGSTTVEVEFTRTIAAPIDAVFARLAAIDAYDTWLRRSAIHLSCGLVEPDADVAVGTEFFDATTMGRVRGRVTEFERPTRIAFEQRLRMGGRTLLVTRPGYVLSPGGDATHVLHRGEAELFGAFRAMAPAARFLASSERKRTLDALEDSFT